MKRAFLIAGLFFPCSALQAAPAHSAEDHAHTAPAKPSAKHEAADHPTTPAPAASADQHEPAFNLEPRAAMARLLDGNDRFRYGESSFPRFDPARRSETFAGGQKPFAAILSCADSRVPVEAVFDQGIGDLFVVRVAGNVADTDEIGTIEYGVGHLGTGLIVVLGHTKCGAVTAVADGADVHGHIAALVDNIAPAVESVKTNSPDARGARMIRLAIRANVQQSMHDLLTKSETIAAAVKSGRAQVVGGVYDLQTGAIEWLGEHPRQQELLSTAPAAGEHGNHASHDKSKPGNHQKGSTNPDKDHHPSSGEPKGHDDKPADKHSQSTTKPRKENWLALGGLLGISAAGSLATIHLLYGRN